MASAQYETTLIIAPEKTDSEVSKLLKNYVKFLKTNKAEIVHEENWGLRNLAYQINKKSTGYYYTVEYKAPTTVISDLELNLKRDEDVLRFLTVKLDKFAQDYNDRKRRGLIGRERQEAMKEQKEAEVAQTEKAEE